MKLLSRVIQKKERKAMFLSYINFNFISSIIIIIIFMKQKLYDLGGRKFMLISMNPIGCSPMVRANSPMAKGCYQYLNRAAHLFNHHLKSLADVIMPQLPGSHFVYLNSYKIIRDIIKIPLAKGKPCRPTIIMFFPSLKFLSTTLCIHLLRV